MTPFIYVWDGLWRLIFKSRGEGVSKTLRRVVIPIGEQRLFQYLAHSQIQPLLVFGHIPWEAMLSTLVMSILFGLAHQGKPRTWREMLEAGLFGAFSLTLWLLPPLKPYAFLLFAGLTAAQIVINLAGDYADLYAKSLYRAFHALSYYVRDPRPFFLREARQNFRRSQEVASQANRTLLRTGSSSGLAPGNMLALRSISGGSLPADQWDRIHAVGEWLVDGFLPEAAPASGVSRAALKTALRGQTFPMGVDSLSEFTIRNIQTGNMSSARMEQFLGQRFDMLRLSRLSGVSAYHLVNHAAPVSEFKWGIFLPVNFPIEEVAISFGHEAMHVIASIVSQAYRANRNPQAVAILEDWLAESVSWIAAVRFGGFSVLNWFLQRPESRFHDNARLVGIGRELAQYPTPEQQAGQLEERLDGFIASLPPGMPYTLPENRVYPTGNLLGGLALGTAEMAAKKAGHAENARWVAETARNKIGHAMQGDPEKSVRQFIQRMAKITAPGQFHAALLSPAILLAPFFALAPDAARVYLLFLRISAAFGLTFGVFNLIVSLRQRLQSSAMILSPSLLRRMG